ncbi:MAG: hypothetical protein IPH10_12270 [bacterium]|nr:hypothetical protein [bacterium]
MYVFISAGEASGDWHGSHVVQALKEQRPNLRFFGLGGDRMAAQGVELLFHAKRLAFMGFAEVVRHLPYVMHVRRTVLHEILERKPELIILIDYPGLHFSLLRYLKSRQTVYKPRILYYIAPQVWAWKAARGPNWLGWPTDCGDFSVRREDFSRFWRKRPVRGPSVAR